MKKNNFNNLNLQPEIETIFNEIYEDFILRYGEKHSERIYQLLMNISTKVEKKDIYEGASAMANSQKGIIYGKNKNLPAILKHELCHVFNDSYFDSNDKTCLIFFPDRYKDFLEENGFLQKTYIKEQEKYKKKWKDEPERLKYLLKDYDQYKLDFTFGDGSQETEKWTEWFNTKINSRNMKNHFNHWNDGFFTKSFSSNSFYDHYINIAEMISKVIPEEKLIDMFMQTPEYNTDFSYKDFIDLFDNTYSDILDDNEKQEYKYPYLKILSNTKTIEDNALSDKNSAISAYQSCTKTCFKAYYKKLDSIKNYNEDDLKKIYNEIEDLQESMMWNLDISKMQELEYVCVLEEIQNKFKEMCILLDPNKQNNEIIKMINTVDYKSNSKFKMIKNGEKIAKDIWINNNTKDTKLKIGKYNINVGERGIKGNLYESLKALFGNESFNLVFDYFQNEGISFLSDSKNGNKLLNLYNKINELDDNIQAKNLCPIYDEIYDLYNQKLNNCLLTDENVDIEFKKIHDDIINLQENSLFDIEEKKYLNSLEIIIQNYKEKEQAYEKFIIKATNSSIINDNLQTNQKRISSKWTFANQEIDKLKTYVSQIDLKKNENSKTQYTPQEIKNATISVSVEQKDKVSQKIYQKMTQLETDKQK